MNDAVADPSLDISADLGLAPAAPEPQSLAASAAALGVDPPPTALPADFVPADPTPPGPRVGAPPPASRQPLDVIPGSPAARPGAPADFTDNEMYKILLAKGLSLMESSSLKVQASVWHDLMEVQGLLGKRGSGDGNGDGSRGSPTLNALIMGDKTAGPLVEAFRQMASGVAVRQAQPARDSEDSR